jgi:hypothetical protein
MRRMDPLTIWRKKDMALLELSFFGDVIPELFETKSYLLPGTVNHSVRGKTAGVYRGSGTFQWTSAVKAVCIAMLRAKLCSKPTESGAISGERGSLAASLDYALSKEPNWLGEMFGFTPKGGLIARRLFLVSNPNRKRAGPVAILLNDRALPTSEILVSLNGEILSKEEDIKRLLLAIEREHKLAEVTDPDAVTATELKKVING